MKRDTISNVKFVENVNGDQVALTPGVNGSLLGRVPSGIYFSGAMAGRIKGSGISITGIEMMILVTTRDEAVVFGRDSVEHWRKPLVGMVCENQALDAVRFTAADGNSIRFATGIPSRNKILNHMQNAISFAATDEEGEIVLSDSEIASQGGIFSEFKTEVLKLREEMSLSDYPEFSSVEEMREAFTPNVEIHGEKVFGGRVCGTRIYVYSKGFVQLGKPGLAPIEKLQLITSSSSVNRKTGIGRTAAAGLTLGMSLAASSNRGYLSLVVVTDRESHEFSTTNPENSELAQADAVVAAGQAVLDSLSKTPVPTQQANSIADEIAKLASLKDSGVLTDEEFQVAKQRLLG